MSALQARRVVGRTIAALEISRIVRAGTSSRTLVDTVIVLDNGARIYAHAEETEYEPHASMHYVMPRPTRKAR